MAVSEEIKKQAEQYIEQETDERFRSEVASLLEDGNEGELEDRFYTSLEFGTGGLRGVVGGGYNRMNSLVIRQASEGLARYVARYVGEHEDHKRRPRAVIAYDSRHFSDVFARVAALVFCANGFETYLFEKLRPTPELSFAVRTLKADTGVVITASHNPPEYSGYKVYWNDGSQVVPPHDTGIIEEVRAVGSDIHDIDERTARDNGLLNTLADDMDKEYLDAVERQIVRPELFGEHGNKLSMVYTPLHGTGAHLVESIAKRLSLPLSTVAEQREPDGDFPTVKQPNPEEGSALRMAIEQAAEQSATIVVGTDPDADRIGTAVPDPKALAAGRPLSTEDYHLVTGNQLGVLLADYVLGSHRERGTLPERPAFVKTIVTTELQRIVAEYHGAEVYDTLTGFKHIAAKIREFESAPGGPTYVLGDEESYGYMIGTEVRDKDGVSATVLTAEMALYYLTQGKSILERLEEIYRQFGYFEERTISRHFKGQDGARIMAELMDSLRREPPKRLGGKQVVRVYDYLERKVVDPETGKTQSSIDLPKSNVLQFELSGRGKVSVRPSGTEPKIKFYISIGGEPGADLSESRGSVGEQVAAIEQEIEALMPQ
ncbi:MAG: phospho-sugar mutase [Spirochaetales bacterium]